MKMAVLLLGLTLAPCLSAQQQGQNLYSTEGDANAHGVNLTIAYPSDSLRRSAA